MGREFSLWLLVILPWLAAGACALVAELGLRLLGPRRAGLLGHYLGFMATVLALMLCVELVNELLNPLDPQDARALSHTPLRELLDPVVVGGLRLSPTLVGDRLSAAAVSAILISVALARMFIPGLAGHRALGLLAEHDELPEAAASAQVRRALWRLAGLGLFEGAAVLFVLASDLGLAAPAWLILGVGGFAVATGGGRGGEQRGDAATRVLGLSLAADLALGAAALALIASGIGLAHGELWAPLTGDRLYALVFAGVSFADLIAALLILAVGLRLLSLAWLDNSLLEALLDASLTTIPALYLLLRYERVLAYAPTVLAIVLAVGVLIAPCASAVALLRPRSWRHGPAPIVGLRAANVAWLALIALAVGVGAWRTVALLGLAHLVARLGLRLSLLVARGDQLPPVNAAVARVMGFAAAGLAPGLGFAALAQTAVDVLTRTSLVGSWMPWPAALVVLGVAFTHAAATARIWYESLSRKPGARDEDELEEDSVDFAPQLLLIGLSVALGVMAIGGWFGWLRPPLSWLDHVLPLAGGHKLAPTGILAWARPETIGEGAVARTWIAASALLVALATGLGWSWARQRFRRATGSELSSPANLLERGLRVLEGISRPLGLAWVALTELAARGIGRGLFEEGPRIAAELARDLRIGLGPRLRPLSPGGARLAVLGGLLGLLVLLGWLYAKPEVVSPLPSEHYDFGGLQPRLIRAGGEGDGAGAPAQPSPSPTPTPTPTPELDPRQELRR